ncbi:MAG: NAD(P)H-dependent glycerol-3-phosphate dehydrogenase [Ndongobacter sp.]|nr:NAD(P)H-dependent glycerol-3-phosphate dehydrogenase [Ndongobacter sp.]
MDKICILGAGSWASALANLLSDRCMVSMAVRREEQCREINEEHTNRRYLKGLRFCANVHATTDYRAALNGASLIINAVPSQATRGVLREIAPIWNSSVPLLNVSKGIERGSGKRLSEVAAEELPSCRFAVLSGPSHAEEVVTGEPTAVVIASHDQMLADQLQNVFMRDTFRVYTGTDVVGVEIGGAVKNILALGIGICDGLRYGDNARAAMVTRGVHEMVRFGTFVGGEAKTLYGLAGLGDLFVTATSPHSRNRNAGELLGRGYTLAEAEIAIGQVIEGIDSCRAVVQIAEENQLDMPITFAVYEMLHGTIPVQKIVSGLMKRERKSEFEDRGEVREK